MSKYIRNTLEQCYKQVRTYGGVHLFMVSCSEQGEIQSDVDQICKYDQTYRHLIKENNVIRINLKEEDYYSPLVPILYIIYEIQHRNGLSKTHLVDVLKLSPFERNFVNTILSNESLIKNNYFLPADIDYLENRLKKHLIDYLNHLLSERNPYIIIVTNLQYSGNTSINFMIDYFQNQMIDNSERKSSAFFASSNSYNFVDSKESERKNNNLLSNYKSRNVYNSQPKKEIELRNQPNALFVMGVNNLAELAHGSNWFDFESRFERFASFATSNNIVPEEYKTSYWHKKPYQAKEINNADDLINVTLNLLNFFCYEEAIHIIQKYFTIVSADGGYDKGLEGKEPVIYNILGRAFLYSKQYEDALVAFDQMYEKAQYINDRDSACRAYIELAYTHIFRSDFESVLHFAEMASHLGEVSMNLRLVAIANFCLFVAYDRTNMQFDVKRLKLLEQNLKDKKLSKELTYVLRNSFAQTANDKNVSKDKALEDCENAIAIAKHLGIKHELAAAYHCLGIVLLSQKNDQGALESFKFSEDLFNEIDVKSELTKTYNSIGFLHFQLENFKSANEYYVKALNRAVTYGDFSEISITLYNLAEIDISCGFFKEALHILDVLQDVMSIRGISVIPFHNLHDILLNKALIYLFLGEVNYAEQMVKRSEFLSVSLTLENNEAFLMLLVKTLIAKYYVNRKQAIDNMEKVTAMVKDDRGIITNRLKVLYYLIKIMVCYSFGLYEERYRCFRESLEFVSINKLITSEKLLKQLWQNPVSISYEVIENFVVPIKELSQIIPLVEQERKVNILWKQVHEMRLISILHSFGLSVKNYEQLASETLRLLSAHFSINGGMIYFINNEEDAEEPTTLIHQFNSSTVYTDFNYKVAKSFINKNISKTLLDFTNVTIGDNVLYKVMIFPLMDRSNLFAQLLLFTFESKSSTLLASQIDSISFITQQLSSQLIMMSQRNKLIQVSTTDMLTGLYNRMEFNNLMNEAISELKPNENIALGFVDLDNFKYYNDNLGHDIGDKLLVWFAELLLNYKEERDIACRWGGDEFLLLMKNCDAQEAEIRMQKILDTLKSKLGYKKEIEEFLGRPVNNLPEKYYLACSIGVMDSSTLPRPFKDSDLLNHADKALYEVKRTGKGRVLNYENMTHEADDQIMESNR